MTVTAGTLESNDCLVTIKKASEYKLNLKSIVIKQYGKHIEQLVANWAKNNNLVVEITIDDKGALDKTIIARLETAKQRMETK